MFRTDSIELPDNAADSSARLACSRPSETDAEDFGMLELLIGDVFCVILGALDAGVEVFGVLELLDGDGVLANDASSVWKALMRLWADPALWEDLSTSLAVSFRCFLVSAAFLAPARLLAAILLFLSSASRLA